MSEFNIVNGLGITNKAKSELDTMTPRELKERRGTLEGQHDDTRYDSMKYKLISYIEHLLRTKYNVHDGGRRTRRNKKAKKAKKSKKSMRRRR
jgi:hypothetical protein